ncbi:hypothetical protein QFZ82_007995 [Streptomyces sp. V4I23]|uniref:sulfotransferase n=1 Tax=Streptomyces sp. V4I23 TaxID=3042282 RepID=UPI0027892C34|nr:sulfotransferase [Streptomyces sp. V4I23]MDQ1013427.1 hypothetical protein [Streptomyces sp. V4I23]
MSKASSDARKFSVPLGFYGLVRGTAAAAPALVGLGRIESALLSRRLSRIPIDRPTYICGLPRSGTTVSLQMLSEHPDIATHRYSDFLMPYLPWLWNRLFPKLPVRAMTTPAQRVHRDRIEVTRDSPEGVEEMLWERYFRHLYDETRRSVLDTETTNEPFERFYADHIRKLLLVRERTRYLTKNDRCITRMRYIRQVFPDARFLLYVRHPVNHVASLLKQDRIWRDLHRDDPRQAKSIQLTGHHAFGPSEVAANVGDDAVIQQIQQCRQEGRNARSRALYWASVYGFVLSQLEDDPELARSVCVVRYEDLCGNPAETIDRILAHTGLSHDDFAATRAQYTEKLSLPDYYRPAFNDAELADIVDATHNVAEAFGYDLDWHIPGSTRSVTATTERTMA